MQPRIGAEFFALALSNTAVAMCAAGLVILSVGLMSARREFALARGLDKLVALTNTCLAVPLAIFGALHFSGPQFVQGLVPKYMPGRMFWVYFVGSALIAASLSIATGIQVRCSGVMLGIMMFLFVAMLYLPGALRTGSRLVITIVFRETSFGSAGLVMAGIAMGGLRGKGRNLIVVGRTLIGLAAIFFGVQHFLHPLGLPVVPLQKQMATWIPARAFLDYLTGTFLVAAGGCILSGRKVRVAATLLGSWIVLLVLVMYVPVMFSALTDPGIGVQIEGINYFADTLLFGGVILSVARAAMDAPSAERLEVQER